MADRNPDSDSSETQEWLDALASAIANEGAARAHHLIERLIDQARRSGVNLPYSATTAYVNTIPASQEPAAPGEPGLEHRIRSLVRWNALAMVVQANRESAGLGGHIAGFLPLAKQLREGRPVYGLQAQGLDGAAPPPGPLALQIPAEFLGRPLVTPELLAFAHAHGVQVHVWTVNDTAEMRRLLALGVDGIMSDFPGRLRSLVDALRGA